MPQPGDGRPDGPQAGDSLAGKYVLGRRLGEGGMGTVWAARHRLSGRRVAIKLIRRDRADAQTRRRLVIEARAASSVEHPNVCQVMDVLELDGGDLALVLELLEGETLARRLSRSPLTVLETANVLLPVLSAIGAAHALGIVHRDLKPDNIFITRGGETKVLDFGIASVGDDLAATHGRITATGVFLGTPAYMAPEQVFGESDVDHRADVWALGIILYECLAGTHPIGRAAQSLGSVLKTIVTGELRPIHETAPEVPEPLQVLVMRMLQRDRATRLRDLCEAFDTLGGFASRAAPSFAPPRRAGSLSAAGEAEARDGADRTSLGGAATTVGRLGTDETAAPRGTWTDSRAADRMRSLGGRGRLRRTAWGLALGAPSLLAVGLGLAPRRPSLAEPVAASPGSSSSPTPLPTIPPETRSAPTLASPDAAAEPVVIADAEPVAIADDDPRDLPPAEKARPAARGRAPERPPPVVASPLPSAEVIAIPELDPLEDAR